MKKLLSILLAAVLALGLAVPALGAEDPAELVTDAFSYTYSDEWGDYGFAVPTINAEGEGIQAVNDAIWANLYEGVLYSEYGAMTAVEEGWSPEPWAVEYDWAVNGDVLSLWTVCHYSGDNDTYAVYNVSLSAGRRITDQELLGVAGIDQSVLYDRAAQALADAFEEMCGTFPEDEFKAQQRTGNNSDANIRAIRPYLDKDGGLSVVGSVYTLAGSGISNRQFTLADRTELPEAISSADLPETVGADERLIYFLEHCDTEYLTQADVEGLDEQSCLYALNGIYARSGRKFADHSLQSFYEQFAWYRPEVEPAMFTGDMLNEFQNANLTLILNYKTEMGY